MLLDNLEAAIVASGNPGRRGRGAFFETALVLARGGSRETLSWTGRLHGHVASFPIGSHGFGYDPIFVPQGGRRTLAQMAPEAKNAISHRSMALRAMASDIGRICAFLW
jgi:XTP/dITP diphosphohydrolase